MYLIMRYDSLSFSLCPENNIVYLPKSLKKIVLNCVVENQFIFPNNMEIIEIYNYNHPLKFLNQTQLK